MRERLRRHITYANVTATLALFIALSGTSYAVMKIGSQQIRNNSVRSVDVRNNSLRSVDVRNRTLTKRDIARNSLDTTVIDEGGLGTVREARLIDGRSVLDLTVKCSPSTRAGGGTCVETALRP